MSRRLSSITFLALIVFRYWMPVCFLDQDCGGSLLSCAKAGLDYLLRMPESASIHVRLSTSDKFSCD